MTDTYVNGPRSPALNTHSLHAQAMSEDELESMKRELHGAGASTLRFAESAEQQHMDIDHDPNELAGPALHESLATRLAPAQGPTSLVQPAPVRPPTQVSMHRPFCLPHPILHHLVTEHPLKCHQK